jgi:DNA-binding GntR family transcriptional regulator
VLTAKQVAAPPEAADALGLEVGAAVTRLERLRFADDQPIRS